MKISSDDQKAISLILICLGFLFFLIGLAAHFKAGFQSRAEIPKIAANDRTKATPEEAQSIVASSIAYYGTYSIDENTKVMVVNLAASTYANVAAVPNQKRTITLLTSDELKFDNPRTPNGMTLRTAWKRAAAP